MLDFNQVFRGCESHVSWRCVGEPAVRNIEQHLLLVQQLLWIVLLKNSGRNYFLFPPVTLPWPSSHFQVERLGLWCQDITSLDIDSLTSISWLLLVFHMHIIFLASWLVVGTQFRVKKDGHYIHLLSLSQLHGMLSFQLLQTYVQLCHWRRPETLLS